MTVRIQREDYHGPILLRWDGPKDIRISPAGPLIPLVFTLTTIKSRLSLCVTYRTTSFREPELLKIVNDFMRRLEQIGKE